MDKFDKTNVMRILDSHKISFKTYHFSTQGLTGEEAAKSLNLPVERVFKTLVTQGKSGKYYVFDVPVAKELDLKKAAASVNEKNIQMIKSKELFPLTGYIHGGCSPIGMKKTFITTFDKSASNYEYIIFSGGQVGCFVETAYKDLIKVIKYQLADISCNKILEEDKTY